MFNDQERQEGGSMTQQVRPRFHDPEDGQGQSLPYLEGDEEGLQRWEEGGGGVVIACRGRF